MIKEHDCVVLTEDLPSDKLKAGDIGTVVLVHRKEAGYEVEFNALDGETITLVTLMADEVRPAHSGEIAHARSFATA